MVSYVNCRGHSIDAAAVIADRGFKWLGAAQPSTGLKIAIIQQESQGLGS